MATAASTPPVATPAAASPALPASAPPARRLTSASAAALELHQHWGAWSAGLGKFALQAAFALMAANWAIHGSSHRGILANVWAKWSMTVGFLYLTFLLILIGRHVLLLRRRHAYADFDRVRWQTEFDRESANVGTPWPYTEEIERNGDVMLWLHFAAPLLMGCLLLVSVFLGGSVASTEAAGNANSPARLVPANGNESPPKPASTPR